MDDHTHIRQITQSTPASEGEAVLALLEEQVAHDDAGMEQTPDDGCRARVRRGYELALAPDSPARVFALFDERDGVRAVCFCNVSVGVQSGGHYLWLNEIYVAPDYRRKGAGRKLLRHVLEWAKDQDCVYVCGITWPGNEPSCRLFGAEGFEASTMVWLDRSLS